MRKKTIPMRVVGKLSSKKQVSKITRSSSRSFKKRKKVKSLCRKVKKACGSYKKPNKIPHLNLLIRPCSVVLTRCDKQVLTFKKTTSFSQDPKQGIPMTLRCKSKSLNYKKTVSYSSKTSTIKKPISKLSSIISKILEKKKEQPSSVTSKQKMPKKSVKRNQSRKQEQVGISFPKSPKSLQINNNKNVIPKSLVFDQANEDNAAFTHSDLGINTFARHDSHRKVVEKGKTTSPALLFLDGVQESFPGQNNDLPLHKICQACGAWFNISTFLENNQGLLIRDTNSSQNVVETASEINRKCYVLRPKQFDKINLCSLASTPIPYQRQAFNYIHCSKCPMMYLKIENLQSHQRVHHFTCNVSSICKYCFQFFHSKWRMIRHAQQLHNQNTTADSKYLTSLQAYAHLQPSAINIHSVNGQQKDNNDLQVCTTAYKSTSHILKRPCKFVVNVPNISNAFVKNKVKMLSNLSYSSYLVKLGDKSGEHTRVDPFQESDEDNEWLSYINTPHDHNYPSDEHNYALVSRTSDGNSDVDSRKVGNGLTNSSEAKPEVSNLIFSPISSNFLEDGVASKTFPLDISHVEEVTENVVDPEQEDFCISLSPDIVKYITRDEDQVSLSELRELAEKTVTEHSYQAESYRHKSYTFHGSTNNYLQKVPFRSEELMIPKKLENKTHVKKTLEKDPAETDKLSTKDENKIQKCLPKVPCSVEFCCEKKIETETFSESFNPFKCNPCKLLFINKDLLSKHMLYHHVYWRCNLCTMVFKNGSCYREHLQEIHRKPNDKVAQLQNNEAQEKEKCKYLVNLETQQRKTFDHRISCIKNNLSSPSSEPSNSSGRQVIKLAPKTFEQEKTFPVHLKKDLKNFSLSSNSENSLNITKNYVIKDFKQLDKKLNTNDTGAPEKNIKSDLSACVKYPTETVSKEDKCDNTTNSVKDTDDSNLGGMPSVSKSNSNNDLLDLESCQVAESVLQDNIKCSSCPAIFTHRNELRTHSKLHSDSTAIICTICSWTFRDEGDFVSHYMVKHIKPWAHRFRKHLCAFAIQPRRHPTPDAMFFKCKFCEISYYQRAVK